MMRSKPPSTRNETAQPNQNIFLTNASFFIIREINNEYLNRIFASSFLHPRHKDLQEQFSASTAGKEIFTAGYRGQEHARHCDE
jgi:hypothetical protein